ncbi:L,D-transpeptidase family protein [Sphingobium bisphenolivorans]|uniref:L,D-transpeptidase family protein n=1 Tax=Sphingobium bisphenolivorans TaxID=1335760 RepID=UPI00039E164C|nr:L,D-transpeptidase family protein [Sphingobium bisphenolivorans]
MAERISTGTKLAIGGGAAAVMLLLALSIGRGRDLPAENVPALAPDAAPAHVKKPAERTRAQPVAVDPRALVVKRVLPIQTPFRHGDYVWDESGAPATGQLIVTVDLKAQTLSVFRAGYEIGAAVIIYGADDKPSPLGAFPITEKDADHVSSLYNAAPMPYMLRLTNDGVAIHGSDVRWGNATHGCIGIPTAFARKLFGVARLGDIVVITSGKMLDTSHVKAAT